MIIYRFSVKRHNNNKLTNFVGTKMAFSKCCTQNENDEVRMMEGNETFGLSF